MDVFLTLKHKPVVETRSTQLSVPVKEQLLIESPAGESDEEFCRAVEEMLLVLYGGRRWPRFSAGARFRCGETLFRDFVCMAGSAWMLLMQRAQRDGGLPRALIYQEAAGGTPRTFEIREGREIEFPPDELDVVGAYQSMTIRDTTVEDAAAVASMIDLVARERRFLAGTVGFSEEATRNFITELRLADAVHVVAELNGSLVGWCDIARLPFEGMRHVGRLGMGVKRDCRGRGIGRQLLESALRQGADRFERVELEVFSSNRPAVQLYESSGFLLEGTKRAARKLDGICDDLLMYAKFREARDPHHHS